MAERQFKRALKEKGPTAVGMFGSGQWTVWEGYAAAKLMKAGLPLQQHRAQRPPLHGLGGRRLSCAPSASTSRWAATTTSKRPTPSCCGARTWPRCTRSCGRLTDRRLSADHVKVAVLSTFEHRCFDLADIPMVFTPQTDLAILNYIAKHIIESGKVNEDFVSKHVNFRLGNPDIGYGLRPNIRCSSAPPTPTRRAARKSMTFEDYAKFVADYDLDSVSELSGVPKNRLEALAEIYADPDTKVMSLWTMGFNQHTRGVWCNNLIYNIHLLTGKIAEPGNSPFSLTGQPSACGTAREVGTFAHRLPADMVVKNDKHREIAEKIWKLPPGHDPAKARLPRGAAKPHAEGRQAQRLLGPGQQQPPGRRQPGRGRASRLPQPGQLHRRLRGLPDGDGPSRRPNPADRHVGREGRRLRQRRAAHAVLAPADRRAGRGALGPVATGRVLQALHDRRGLAGRALGRQSGVQGQDPLRGAVRQRPGRQLSA